MRWPPSKMGRTDRERLVWILFGLMTVFSVPMCHGTTYSLDVDAINSLYTALGLPLLPGWSALGGDPCGDGWKGVQCVNANITGIVLNGADLGGELSADLGDFSALIQMDLSNNKIGGSIPSSLPITLRSFLLSGNQFNGSIPDTLSTLGQLTALSFSDNHLTGEIPDAFQTLTGLITLDLSGNNLSGQLPPSMGSLSSLTTLDLQNNQLIGRLDVLEDLPLTDLDIENNQFWGPIPKKLMNIQNFRRTGNPFNTSVIPPPPSPPPLPTPSSSPPPSGASGASSPSGSLSPPAAQSPQLASGTQALGPSAPGTPNSSTGLKSLTTNKVWIAVGGLIVSALLALALCFCVPKCCKRCQPASGISKSREMDAYEYSKAQPKMEESFSKLYSPMEKGLGDPGLRPPIGHGNDLRIKPEAEKKIIKTMTSISDMTDSDADILDMPPPPPPPPPPFLSVDKVAVNPIFAPVTMTGQSSRSPNSVRSFTIASLQQFTNSFSQANLIGGGMLGTVYRAELPIGKPLAVKKLDAAVCRKQSNEDFLELVSDVSRLQHPNVVELVGYCAEHGQQLLVYEYCGNGTLHEALHLDDEIHKKLSWNTRIRLALGAATALEYLHEVCQPVVVHKNFKSANILLDDKLVVHVSDCGLAPLISSVHISQMSGHGYGAPEVEFGSYTSMSDVYSFGVVMLELLTGRKSYDRSRTHGEQHLVRWAVPQLHDIDSLSRMVDPSLNGAYPSKALSRFADIISLCLQPEPEFRPPISEIVQNLLNMV